MHERVHEEGNESRGSVKITRGLPLRSARLGLVGVADVVEFHRQGKGIWHPFPVEYKRGKPKPDHSDTIQLCAQALCLEEMLSVSVPTGALFYGRTRRRLDVSFTDVLRNETERAAEEAHRIINSGMTPAPVYGKRCKNCSLVGQCLPNRTGKKSSVRRYLERMVKEL
jgi:CRISPR-associated exonuclease Cas4